MYKGILLPVAAALALTLSAASVIAPSSAFSAPWTKENAAWNVNMNPEGSDPSRYFGQWPNHTYFPSPPDWRKISIYHVITDRFRDDNPLNDAGKYGGFDPGQVDQRHGGDFAGITSRLDYIKSLGFNAILLSPMFQNQQGDYHGYSQIDFTLLDDRFGTLEEFRTLVSEAHARGIYVIADIIVNHMSYLLTNEGYAGRIAPFRMHSDEYRLVPRWPDRSYADFHVDNIFVPDAKYCDVYSFDGSHHTDSGSGSYALSDFNHNGDLINDYANPWNISFGQIYGKYNDLRLCSEKVQAKLVAMTSALIASTDIDAIRIDTPMQVPLGFFKQWTPLVKRFAASLGKDNFFMFGELYSQRGRAATMIGRGKTPQMYGKSEFISDSIGMDAGIHYGFFKRIIIPNFIEQNPDAITQFAELLRLDKQTYDLSDSRNGESSYRMVNFYNNHDQRRLASYPSGIAKSRAAEALLAFWPGIPMHYYGDEQGFCAYGSALSGHAREAMMSSFAWDKFPAACSPNPAAGDSFDMASHDYRFTRRLYQSRAALSEVLSDDAPRIHIAQNIGSSRVLVFQRSSQSGKDRVLIALNIGEKAVEVPAFSVTEALPGIKDLQNVLVDGQVVPVSDKGMLHLKLAPFEAKVLVPSSQKFGLPLAVEKASPSHDSVVPQGIANIEIAFTEPLDPQTLKDVVRINDQLLPRDHISLAKDAKSLRIKATLTNGVHYLTIAETLRSRSGRTMASPYHVRYRTGSPESILVRRSPWFDPKLVEGGQTMTNTNSVKLSHQALGTGFFRVINSGSPHWSEWKPLVAQSTWELAPGGGWRGVTVQYWIDGSAAYFVSGGIDVVTQDGITSENS